MAASPVEIYKGREIFRTADVTLVTAPANCVFCVENLRESDEGPTLHTDATIEEIREFIDADEAD